MVWRVSSNPTTDSEGWEVIPGVPTPPLPCLGGSQRVLLLLAKPPSPPSPSPSPGRFLCSKAPPAAIPGPALGHPLPKGSGGLCVEPSGPGRAGRGSGLGALTVIAPNKKPS